MKYPANRLRVIRAERRISQLDVAMRAQIGQQRFWKIENSYIEPTPEERAAIAQALEVSEAEAFPEAIAS